MWDEFFYYDSVPVEDINKKELIQMILQPAKSLYYNRSYGIDAKYNYPQSAFNQILLAYSISNLVAKRNQNVTDGSNGYPDRRIAVSQSSIKVVDGKNGERDVIVYYFNYKNYKVLNNATMAVQ